jgi:hypothetical protein
LSGNRKPPKEPNITGSSPPAITQTYSLGVVLPYEDMHIYDELKEERNILKKGSSILREGKLVKYAYIKSNQERFTVTRMCKMMEVMEVSQSAY